MPDTTPPYVILRCTSAGVHAGTLVARGDTYILRDSRRIWYWDGAASLSEIAVYGCAEARRANCKFAACVPLLELRAADVCEIIHCTPAGRAAIEGVPEWRA